MKNHLIAQISIFQSYSGKSPIDSDEVFYTAIVDKQSAQMLDDPARFQTAQSGWEAIKKLAEEWRKRGFLD